MHGISSTAVDGMNFVELDRLREELRLPQVKLCQRGDLNPASYTRWRRWARSEPRGVKPSSRSLKCVRDVLKDELSKVCGLVAAE